MELVEKRRLAAMQKHRRAKSGKMLVIPRGVHLYLHGLYEPAAEVPPKGQRINEEELWPQ